jgi:hypothetical protein
VTSTRAEHRATAVAAIEETCPRCGARRSADQDYCVECGLELPVVSGRIASLRRRWIRRVGWYPGDWVWASLATLVVAIAGAAVAIALTRGDGSSAPAVAPPPATTTPVTTSGTATTPGKPKPKPTPAPPAQPNGSVTWPENRNGWTIVLASYPRTTGRLAAVGLAHEAARKGLRQVGVLDSSLFPSLQPGYDVVFSGIFGSDEEAQSSLPGAHQAGFSGAYPRQIAR